MVEIGAACVLNLLCWNRISSSATRTRTSSSCSGARLMEISRRSRGGAHRSPNFLAPLVSPPTLDTQKTIGKCPSPRAARSLAGVFVEPPPAPLPAVASPLRAVAWFGPLPSLSRPPTCRVVLLPHPFLESRWRENKTTTRGIPGRGGRAFGRADPRRLRGLAP